MSENEHGSTKPMCFVVGPIGSSGSEIRKHSDMLLHLIIRHVLHEENFGFEVRRADDDARPGMIGDRIIHDLINSQLVIADLTELNPNVFYELGIRHSTEKATIHIAKTGTKLPFDNQGHDTIFVDVTDWQSIESSRSRLKLAVLEVLKSTYKVSNPITQAQATFKFLSSSDPKERYIAELSERISLLESRPQVVSESHSTTIGEGHPIPFILEKINNEMARFMKSEGSSMSDFHFMNASKKEIFRLANAYNVTVTELHLTGEMIRYQIMGYDVTMYNNGIYMIQANT
ncbi:hypothetical protein FPV16_15035 [Methylobacterium sp. W2]|uniref:hypothetical protein n=1 Tax=Methylobacterium sp. W2 TaxID=2598107 RepID=UPI001D0C0A0E|nr:hypothetical protein [Methylobacterium sp. W2]MCC0807528.1 hypothetical protein [Methylobacterium sp. W2]